MNHCKLLATRAKLLCEAFKVNVYQCYVQRKFSRIHVIPSFGEHKSLPNTCRPKSAVFWVKLVFGHGLMGMQHTQQNHVLVNSPTILDQEVTGRGATQQLRRLQRGFHPLTGVHRYIQLEW
eukprot:5599395-Amphidinium_carterae.1